MRRLRGKVTHLLIAASLLFSFSFASLAPAVTYAQDSSTKSSKSQDHKKKVTKKKTTKTAKTTTKTVTQTVTIPFATQHQDDPSLPSGQTEILQAGKNGAKVRKYSVTYKNGKQTKKKLVSEKVTVAPVNQIIGDGKYVAPAPTPTPAPSTGNGATAQCVDGSYSYAAHHQGACSHHGGVATWYN